MPGLDKTGPMGKGSQTGRKLGICRSKTSKNISQNKEDLLTENRFGTGFRRGQGCQGGRRRGNKNNQ